VQTTPAVDMITTETPNMKITVASGKGGTGKTTVAVNFFLSVPKTSLLDCDVEEPNSNLFLHNDLKKVKEVTIPVPVIDEQKCEHCGKCADFCNYNALAALPQKVMVFSDLCHGCGGCSLVCPNDAISETGRSIGNIERSLSGQFHTGLLNIGEAMASPLIKELKTYAGENTVIMDAPPGTACPMITTVEDTDYCILVTEPTPFGLNDLKLAAEVVREMKIPAGVVINRAGVGDGGVEEYCHQTGLPIIMEIPYDRRIAEVYSEGIPFVETMPQWKEKFLQMFETIKEAVR